MIALRDVDAIDPSLGLRMDFVDPTTGKSPIKTLTASMSLFPVGFKGEPYRTISGAVMTVVEGTGTVRIGGEKWSVSRNDVFIVPSWCWHSFEADEELIIFGFSDEVLQRHLGFWREDRTPPAGLDLAA